MMLRSVSNSVSIANNNFFLRRSEKKSIKRNADYCSFFTRTFAIRMECCDSTFPEPANIPWKMNSFFTAHLPMHPVDAYPSTSLFIY